MFYEIIKSTARRDGMFLYQLHAAFDERRGKTTTRVNFEYRLKNDKFTGKELAIIFDILGYDVELVKRKSAD